ncbi:MAG: hypothetical protein HY738_21255 [Bacteroidia bacterium]|nr:hypothetical protein [Bacteroidia bacterium]
MSKQEIFFRPIGNSGPLTIYWYPGPYGVAVECKKGKGVAWISPCGTILGVEFDDVSIAEDHQILEPGNGSLIEVFIKNGKVKTYVKC